MHVGLRVIAYVLLCGCLPFDDDAARINSPNASKKFELRFPSWARGLSRGARFIGEPAAGRSSTKIYGGAVLPAPVAARDCGTVFCAPVVAGDARAAPRGGSRDAVAPSRPSSRAGPADYAVLDNDGRARPASRRKNSF